MGAVQRAELAVRLQRLERLATLMDSSLRLPVLGWRFGLDPLLGLLPGVGDLIGACVSLWIVVESWRLGASLTAVVRMIGNLLLDAIVGAVPLLGDLADFALHTNRRNLAVLAEDLALNLHNAGSGPTATRELD
ncbi:MAG: DUF4112 domain-containing protein [Pseudomonadota bacterium]